METSEADLRTFFDDYRTTFASFDLDALGALFTFPMHVVSATDDEVSVAVYDGDAWPAVLEMLFGAYRGLGVAGAELLAFETSAVSPDVASVRVHWELRRNDGSSVYDFTAVYTVVVVDGALRVTAIAHDELPQLGTALSGAPDG
jgi:hypothetical protein